MSKNLDKKQSGNFTVVKKNYKKYKSFFAATILVVVLVLGVGLVIYKSSFKKQASKEVSQSILPSWWLKDHFGASVCEQDNCKPDADPDKDKLTNAQEYFYHSNPLLSHTANDKLNDGELVAAGFDPSRPDRQTFEDVASDENIIGESLVYDQDLKKLATEGQDISKVNLPLVADSDLKLNYSQSPEVYKKYLDELQTKINKYFSQTDLTYVTQVIESGSGADVENIKVKASLLSEDLKKIEVPSIFITYHKYNIAFYKLLSEIILNPSEADLFSESGDTWYDNVKHLWQFSKK